MTEDYVTHVKTRLKKIAERDVDYIIRVASGEQIQTYFVFEEYLKMLKKEMAEQLKVWGE
ncbi:MAG: hypothetical protein IJT54_05960 [Candidatus Methanomethylophilaceae archaeon]|nr:hypothetical protein [Candidatus Methanomethylophilaceae archaeon]